MTTYRIVWDTIVDADSEAEALDESRQLVRSLQYEADIIEEVD